MDSEEKKIESQSQPHDAPFPPHVELSHAAASRRLLIPFVTDMDVMVKWQENEVKSPEPSVQDSEAKSPVPKVKENDAKENEAKSTEPSVQENDAKGPEPSH